VSNETSTDSDIKIEGFYQNKLITDASMLKYNETIELHLISEKFGFDSPKVFYKLNYGTDFLAVEKNKIVLNNLSSGKQHVVLYYFDGNQYKEISKYTFVVTNPWYLSVWMVMVYSLLLAVLFYLYYIWNKIRYIEKLKRKEEEINHQNQIEQLERETANKLKMQEYEKHILEIQVQTKASEVAGKSLSIVRND
jgi:AraC family chitin signaling transcriptional activator